MQLVLVQVSFYLATGAFLQTRNSTVGTHEQGELLHLRDVITGEGESGCVAYITSVLKALERSYTKAQVPHVFGHVCKAGPFHSMFPSEKQCEESTEKLMTIYESDKPDYKAWCDEVADIIAADIEAAAQSCECVPIPEALVKTEGEEKYVLTKEVEGEQHKYPTTYGSTCDTHDLPLKPYCEGKEYPPSFCHEKWCYVSSECKAKDVKESFFFEGTDKPLYYSYNNCGGIDAYAAEACLGKGSADECTGFSKNCAWSESGGVCQNKLCQCKGEGDGSTCGAWDKTSCESDDTEGRGLWCCKQWCYVDESCPSAMPAPGAEGKFLSYFACPDVVEDIASCPWKEAVDREGNALPLTGPARDALSS